jgi:nitrogen fixation protein FixH
MSSPISIHPPLTPPPRSLWPISIIVFFGVAIVGIVLFVAFCNLHSEELVSADYYEQEVRFQGQMERVQRTQALGAKPGVRFDAAARVIRLEFPAGVLESSTTGHVMLYRPSARQQDREIQFDPALGGSQTIDASQLSPGLWRVRTSWTTAGREYFAEEKLVIPALEK